MAFDPIDNVDADGVWSAPLINPRARRIMREDMRLGSGACGFDERPVPHAQGAPSSADDRVVEALARLAEDR